MLEELVLSENSIEEIPVSMSLMSNLRIIKLANNRLKTIPYEIADILTLEEIDCSNNHNLESIPAKWRGDTESILFTTRVHRGIENWYLIAHSLRCTVLHLFVALVYFCWYMCLMRTNRVIFFELHLLALPAS